MFHLIFLLVCIKKYLSLGGFWTIEKHKIRFAWELSFPWWILIHPGAKDVMFTLITVKVAVGKFLNEVLGP